MKYRRNILTAGRYLARCKSAVEKLSKSGSEMIEMIWEVEDNGGLFEVKSFLTPKMAWIIDQIKKSIGLDLEEGADAEITPEVLINKYLLVDVECAEYQGQPQNSIRKYMPYEGQLPENAVTSEEETPF